VRSPEDRHAAPARGIDVRNLFLGLGAAFFGLALLDRLLGVFAEFSSILLICFLTWLFAFLMKPLVDALDRRLPSGRGVAILAAYGAVVGSVALFVAAMAQVGVSEAANLLSRTAEIGRSIAKFAADAQATVGISTSLIDLGAVVGEAQANLVPAIAQQLNDQTQTIAGAVISGLGNLFIVVVLSVYAVADPGSISGALRRAVPNRHTDNLLLVQRTVGRAFRGFLRAQLILVGIQIVLTLAVGVVFGLPYLFLVTVSTAVLMFIPFFGPPLALIPIAFLAIAFRPDLALAMIVFVVVVQTIVVNAVQPKLLKEGVGLHPILVILALLVGSQVAGLWGAVFAIPVVAILNLLLRYAIDLRAVSEVEGLDVEEVVAELQAEEPGLPVEDAVAIAAARAEAVQELETR
jgi:predicted PurR-regulated permease PerM